MSWTIWCSMHPNSYYSIPSVDNSNRQGSCSLWGFLPAESSKCDKSACYSLGLPNCYLLPRFPCGFACEVKECPWTVGFISNQVVLYFQHAHYSTSCTCVHSLLYLLGIGALFLYPQVGFALLHYHLSNFYIYFFFVNLCNCSTGATVEIFW